MKQREDRKHSISAKKGSTKWGGGFFKVCKNEKMKKIIKNKTCVGENDNCTQSFLFTALNY